MGVVGLGEVAHLAVVLPLGPGRGQLAGGIGLAQHHVRQGVAQGHARLGQQQDILHLEHRGEVHHAAHIEHQQELAVLLAAGQDVPDFRLGQLEIPRGGVAVRALAGDAAQHVDAELPFPIQGQVVLGLGHDGAHAQQQRGDTQLFGLRLDARHKAHMGLLAQGAVALQPGLGGDGEPGVLQAFLHGGVVAHIHVAGAGAALDGLPGAAAIEGYLTGGLQGEGAVAFQQDHALGGQPAQQVPVFTLVFVQFHENPPSAYSPKRFPLL